MFYVEKSLKMVFLVDFGDGRTGNRKVRLWEWGGTPPGGGPGVKNGPKWVKNDVFGGFVRVPRENPYLGHFRRRFPSGCTNLNRGTPPGGVILGGGPPPGGVPGSKMVQNGSKMTFLGGS